VTTIAINALLNANAAALEAIARLAPFEPVNRVGYRSQGRLLILTDQANQVIDARRDLAIARLHEALSIAVFADGVAAPAIKHDGIEVRAGRLDTMTGYLGAFMLSWRETASKQETMLSAQFDLVLDLRMNSQAKAAFTMAQPPQGYFHVKDDASLETALTELPEMVGEFEKPKFFAYKESICAHSRSKKTGCNRCIDICSTQAIKSAGDIVEVDPHLCMGCGACASVCPSGAMTYQYPRVADRGVQIRAAISAWNSAWNAALQASNASKSAPVLVFRASSLQDLVLPPSAIAIDAWHVAAIGADILLGAVASGAAGVVLLAAGSEAPQYQDALEREIVFAETILHALGYAGKHFAWVSPSDVATTVDSIAMRAPISTIASFHLSNDKRATLEFAIEHLAKHAPTAENPLPQTDVISLPAGSMVGALVVNKETCTMCLACAGACPASALMDGGEEPKLKFLERNCVQCGLCVNTCPEKAITLVPRWNLAASRKKEVILNETEPFDCISCGKALGTRKMIDMMLGKLAGHSMFQGEGSLRRLQMCADCRVVDMMSNKHEISVLTGKPKE
jgi:ferredoxin